MFFFPFSLFFPSRVAVICILHLQEWNSGFFICLFYLSHFYLLFLFYSRYWKIVSTLPSNALVEVLDNNLLVSSFLRAFHVSLVFLNCYSFMGTTSFLGKNHILCSLFVLDPTSVLKFSLWCWVMLGCLLFVCGSQKLMRSLGVCFRLLSCGLHRRKYWFVYFTGKLLLCLGLYILGPVERWFAWK